jgi:hypothetical protein
MGPGLCGQRGARLRMDALQPCPAGSITSVPNQNQNQTQNQTQSPGLAARQRRRLGWGGCLNLRWSAIPKFFPTWARIPTKHDFPKPQEHPSRQPGSQNNDGPLTRSTNNHGQLRTWWLPELPGIGYHQRKLRYPTMFCLGFGCPHLLGNATAGHRCGLNRR